VNTVVLHKTGTLTLGRTEVQAVVPATGGSEVEVLDAAASAEMHSEHPLGKAIIGPALARSEESIPERASEFLTLYPVVASRRWWMA
jgi:P-type Cu+ transporter